VNYPFLWQGASCFTEKTLSTDATGHPSPARKTYTKKHMMFSAFIPHLAEGRGFPAEKVKFITVNSFFLFGGEKVEMKANNILYGYIVIMD